MWQWMMAAGTALAFASGCAEDSMDMGEPEAHSGLDNVRAGLEMAQEGMDRHDDGDLLGLGMMRDSMAMMRTGMDGMRSGFEEMSPDADDGMAGMHGMMGMMGGCGGTIGDMMAPMDEGVGHMQQGLDMMGDDAQDNEAEGAQHFHEGSGRMADGLDGAMQAMACMGHTSSTTAHAHGP